MSGRSEYMLDLSCFGQRVEERRARRSYGRASSVARRSVTCLAGLLGRTLRRPCAVT